MSMNFILTGQDRLSRILDRAGDASDRLGRRLLAASINGDAAVRRFTNNASRNLAGLQRDNEAGAKSLEQLKKAALLLAPAAIPVAASLVPVAAGAGAVAVALGVMGAALGPQIAKLGDAAEAHKKYKDAVDKSGASSQEAVTAQMEYQRLIAKMPPETRRAAAALAVLKDETRDWSDSLAGDTMAPLTKGLAIANALLPKTQGLVKGTAAETDRFMTVLGVAMATPGFDRVNAKFEAFATGTLRKVNDGLVHLMRTGDGEVGGRAREFMDWARAQGPTVSSVLQHISTALMNVMEAGSDVGVGLLQAVDVIAQIVAAVPPSAISMYLQLALALRLTRAAALGMAAGRTALAAFGGQLVAMQTAAAAAPGRLAAVTASIGALSRGAKLALAGTGIGLLAIALTELASIGRDAPPDVDRLTTSLGNFARTGKVSGEAAKAYGANFDKLASSLRTLSRPSNAEATQQWLTSLIGMDSTPVEKAKEDLDGLDKALANLVKAGRADLAEAVFDKVAAAMRKQGMTAKELKKQLGDYKAALADQKFEAELAAQSQGLFGEQAQKTQAALAAQKASADGLRQSLQALNDVQRAGLGGMIGFEAAIDAAAKAAKENANSLDMSGGKLNLNSEKARNAATALQDLASKTDEAATSARESGSSWETVSGIYSRGRDQFIASARAMGLTKTEAAQLADQIMAIPNKKTRVTMDKEDAQKGLESFNAAVKRSPGSKSVTLKTLSKGAESILESFGLKVKRLPNGKVVVSAKAGQALSSVQGVKAAVDSLYSKSITITAHYRKDGASFLGASGRYAAGGHVRGYASGGEIQAFPEGGYVRGPGTSVSDSILALFGSGARGRVANTEYVIRSAIVQKYGVPFFDALNAGRLMLPGLSGLRFADGGPTGAGAAVAGGLAVGMTGSTGQVSSAARVMAASVLAGIRDELEIASPSRKTKALAADIGKGLIVGMTGSRDKIKSTAKDLAKDIWAAFDGSKDSRLVAMVNRQTKRMLSLASQRDKIAAQLKAGKELAESSRVKAKQGAGLSSMFGGDQEEVSAGAIKGRLASRLEKMKQFSRYISELAKRGLSKTMLREILEMGPEEGYAYASALAGTDRATFKAINSTQFKINDEAKKLGRKGADALYDSGKNASKGFLAGLESQQKSLEKLMLKIAKGMQRALRDALGIKSPARKLIPDGVNTARGIGVGVLQGLPYIDSAMDAVAGRITGRAAAPGLAAVAGRPAVMSASAAQPVHVQVDVHGAMDPVAVGREFRRVLLKLKRDYGGNFDLGVG